MIYIAWRNSQTREAYFTVLQTWQDPRAAVQGWLDVWGTDAAETLAVQLRKDIEEDWYGGGAFFRALLRPGLRRVDWMQIATRLLEHYAAKEPLANNDGGSFVET